MFNQYHFIYGLYKFFKNNLHNSVPLSLRYSNYRTIFISRGQQTPFKPMIQGLIGS